MKILFISLALLAFVSVPADGKRTSSSSGKYTNSAGGSSSSSANRHRDRPNFDCLIGLLQNKVDVGEECCRGWKTLYADSNSTLTQKSDACDEEVVTTWESNLTNYCDSDVTECRVDYRDFTCDEAYISECKAIGGAYAEYDVSSTCTYSDGDVFTSHSLDEPTCVPAVCSGREIIELLKAPEQFSEPTYRASCKYEGIQNIKANGVPIHIYQPLKLGDDDNDSIIAYIVVVLVLVLFCCGGCFLYKYKRHQQADEATKGSPDNTAQPTAAVITPVELENEFGETTTASESAGDPRV